MPRILVVCFGNLCRSPLAAGMLRARLPRDDWTVTSAGTHAVDGDPPAPLTRRVAREQEGITLDDERSALLTVQMVEGSDHVFTMSRRQAAVVVDLVPEAADRTRLLGAFAPSEESVDLREGPGGGLVEADEIGDPMGGDLDVYQDTYRHLARACDALTDWLLSGADPADAPASAADGLLDDR